MRKPFLLWTMLLMIPLCGNGQYFQFSQYNFTDQRVNPAMVASSDYATAEAIFRNQTTGANEIQLRSSSLSAAYPFLSGRTGKRWSGLGVSFLDDRSGGIFAAQEASLSYALNVFLSRYQFLSLGFKGLYRKRSVDLSGLFTGAQYIQDRGFDGSVSNGENIGLLRSDFATFSSGLYWQQNDRQGRKVAYWGISFFDMNRPEESFLGGDDQLHATWVAAAGLRLYQEANLSFMPEMLLTHSAARGILNIGAVTSYEVRKSRNQVAARVDLITKYAAGRSGIIGLQLHREHFSVGFSYDFPVFTRNPGNVGAFEVGIQIRDMVDPALRRRAARKPAANARAVRSNQRGSTVAKDTSLVRAVPTPDDSTVIASKPVEPDVKTSLRQKTDSVITQARAGRLSHEPFVIERLNLHFNFEFNSSTLNEASTKYLDDLSEALKENEHMKVKLTGHTDNIGSEAFNKRLSVYRATVVRQYLIDRGVEPARIEADGKGMTEPLNDNKTHVDRAANRRVELLIYYQE